MLMVLLCHDVRFAPSLGGLVVIGGTALGQSQWGFHQNVMYIY